MALATTEPLLPWGQWNKAPQASGIYRIIHLPSGLEYVGSAVLFYGRARHHRNDLLTGTHHSQRLQRSFTKHGCEEFAFQVLEYVEDRAILVAREQFHIDSRQPQFNNAKRAGSILGVRRSPETIEKLRIAAKLRSLSPEYRAKLSIAATGKPKSEAHRKALSRAVTGMRHTPETRAKIAAAGIGRRQSPEAIEKTASAHRGRIVSPETRAKISASKVGKTATITPEADAMKRQRMREAWAIRKARNAN